MSTVGKVIGDLLSLKSQEVTLRNEFLAKLNTIFEVRGERLKELRLACGVKDGIPLEFGYNGMLYNERFFTPNVHNLFGSPDLQIKQIEPDTPIPEPVPEKTAEAACLQEAIALAARV